MGDIFNNRNRKHQLTYDKRWSQFWDRIAYWSLSILWPIAEISQYVENNLTGHIVRTRCNQTKAATKTITTSCSSSGFKLDPYLCGFFSVYILATPELEHSCWQIEVTWPYLTNQKAQILMKSHWKCLYRLGPCPIFQLGISLWFLKRRQQQISHFFSARSNISSYKDDNEARSVQSFKKKLFFFLKISTQAAPRRASTSWPCPTAGSRRSTTSPTKTVSSPTSSSRTTSSRKTRGRFRPELNRKGWKIGAIFLFSFFKSLYL